MSSVTYNVEKDLPKLQLIILRDYLFEKYIELYDKHEKWASGKAKLAHFRVTGKDSTRKELAFMIKNHMMEISEELRKLDSRISKFSTPGDLYVQNSEIY